LIPLSRFARSARSDEALILIGVFCGLFGIVVAVLGGTIAFGTETPPVPLSSIGMPFESVDFRDLPAVEKIPSRTGRQIAFRRWGNDLQTPASQPIVVAIHGSSATSSGFNDFADLVAAVQARHPNAKPVLIGFSSGVGFALHVAASPLGKAFERTVLISPMLVVRSPTVRPEARACATAFVPRILAIKLLNEIGIHVFDHLNVLAFAIDPKRSQILTGYYSFLLTNAFATADYAADLPKASSPMAILVGEQDELFNASLFAPTIGAIRTDIPVTVVPETNHIAMIVDPRAVPAIAEAIRGIR
jgi:pimeloyl-ACP methyl ester carboxylesterase